MDEQGKSERLTFLRNTRKELLSKLGLPEETAGPDVQALLEAKQIIDRLNRINRRQDKKDQR